MNNTPTCVLPSTSFKISLFLFFRSRVRIAITRKWNWKLFCKKRWQIYDLKKCLFRFRLLKSSHFFSCDHKNNRITQALLLHWSFQCDVIILALFAENIESYIICQLLRLIKTLYFCDFSNHSRFKCRIDDAEIDVIYASV